MPIGDGNLVSNGIGIRSTIGQFFTVSTSGISNDGTGPGGSIVDIEAGWSVILGVLLPDTQTVTSITNSLDATDAGFTLVQSFTAQSYRLVFYEQRFDAPVIDPIWRVDYGPSIPFDFFTRAAGSTFLFDAGSRDSFVRAITETDGADVDELVFASLQSAVADHILTYSISRGVGSLVPKSPLNGAASSGFNFGLETRQFSTAEQVWQSAAPTGTRRHAAFTPGTVADGLGVMLLVGGDGVPPPLRQRQRDDDLAQGGPRQRGTAANHPTSKQQSIRQGWRNTYL